MAVCSVNESLGAEYLYLALGRGLRDGNVPLVRRCIEALASVGDPRPPKDNTLVASLAYPDKYVRIEAALALVTLSPAGNLGGAPEAARVLAAGLGARTRPRVAILTEDEALYQRLGGAVEAADMVVEAHRNSANVAQRVKELASPVSLLVIDARVEGPRTAAFVKSLRDDARTAKLPVILLASPNEVETLRADTLHIAAAVFSLTADAAAVKAEIVNSAASSAAPGADDVRDNVELVQQILRLLAELPPATNYPTQDLAVVAAGFLRNQPDEMRILALRAIANLPHPSLRDMVYEIYIAAGEPAGVRHEAGAAFQKLLVLNPRMDAQQLAALRSLTSDADEQIRMNAIHALAIASIPQGEREASLQEVAAKLFPAPSAPAALPTTP
jgi:CheY-like chemotaxis protein